MSMPARCAARMMVSPFSKGISRPSILILFSGGFSAGASMARSEALVGSV
jgi:hypothetical protein